VKTDLHWKKVGLFPHHGICVPLFSLQAQKGCGIGEFLDLIPLIQWCKKVGFDCLQLLPLNDQGMDQSPYNPLSSCALDPIYLSLRELPGAKGFDLFESKLERRELKKLKLSWLRRYFEENFEKTKEHDQFLEKHAWLTSYAKFMTLKERYEYRHWKEWPSTSDVTEKQIQFHSFVQFLCFSQMEKVHDFATKNAFLLIGDLPILLSPDSVDVWTHPNLFRLDLIAGAPPDRYNAHGQKWGFPLFNWDEMRKSEFSWWKQRLKTIESLYHIYRLDHVVGFFRIWAIPPEKPSEEGFFIPKDPPFWPRHGEEILQTFIESSPLLPIGEDLGTIPSFVRPILKNLGICGMKILRWEGDTPYQAYEPLSITSVSTPDMEPLFLWWEKYPEEASLFAKKKNWTYQPHLTPDQQISILKDAHHTSSLFHVNLLQEYLFPFKELISSNLEEERINVPGTLSLANWTYRFRPTLEEIIEHRSLSKMIEEILRA